MKAGDRVQTKFGTAVLVEKEYYRGEQFRWKTLLSNPQNWVFGSEFCCFHPHELMKTEDTE